MKLDDFTARHCRKWADRFAPSNKEPEDIAKRLLAFLEGCDEEDGAFWFERGWTELFDHVEEITRRQAGELAEVE